MATLHCVEATAGVGNMQVFPQRYIMLQDYSYSVSVHPLLPGSFNKTI